MTSRRILDLGLTTDGDQITLDAPRVGAITALVTTGRIVQPGQPVALLESLNTVTELRVPHAAGTARVADVLLAGRSTPTAWGQPVLRLEPAAFGDAEARPDAGDERAAALGLPDGARPIPAPVDGQFYRRPSPDEPPFVEDGDTITAGTVVGLVEVMKFFYEVEFEPPAGSGQTDWRVERFVADDGHALTSGDAIAWVVPDA